MTRCTRSEPAISVVLATHNRRDVVLNTLSKLAECGLPRDQYEVVVVDNASADGTAEAVDALADCVFRLRVNRGSCAKAFGVGQARGRYIVFLDDDSHPQPGSLARMIDRFEEDPALGAVGFTVTLPDGRQEGAALPNVFVGCGVGFRREALQGVGGLDRTFFMQAEEYDLAFRLANAGWGVQVFDDLSVRHMKTPQARRSERTGFYDARNNLRVIARYLPAPYHRIYREDCIERYRWFAQREGHVSAFRRGLRAGLILAAMERVGFRRQRLRAEVFELFFRVREVEARMRGLPGGGVRRVVLANLGKNVFPFHRGARLAQLELLAIGDDRFAAPGRVYRGTPVVPLDQALSQHCDAVVIADTGRVHAAHTRRLLERKSPLPIHDWFGSPTSGDGFASPLPAPTSDDIAVLATT